MKPTHQQYASAQRMIERAMEEPDIPAFIPNQAVVKVTKSDFMETMRGLEECRCQRKNALLKYIGDPRFWLGLLIVSLIIWIVRTLLGLQ